MVDKTLCAIILMIWQSFKFDIQFLIGKPPDNIDLSSFLCQIDK